MFNGDVHGDIALGVARHRHLFDEFAEIVRHFMPRPRGERGEHRTAAEVRPGHHIGDFRRIRIGLDRFQHIGVPVKVLVAIGVDDLVAFAAKFRDRRQLAARFCHARQHRHVFHQLARPFVLGKQGVVGVIRIHAEHIDHVVARIEQLVAAFVAVEVAIGRKGGEELTVQPVFFQVIDDVTEQLFVSLGAAALVIPPRPFAVRLMQRAENEGDFRTVIAHRVLAGLDNRIQPAV